MEVNQGRFTKRLLRAARMVCLHSVPRFPNTKCGSSSVMCRASRPRLPRKRGNEVVLLPGFLTYMPMTLAEALAGNQSVLQPQGPVAKEIASLSWYLMATL